MSATAVGAIVNEVVKLLKDSHEGDDPRPLPFLVYAWVYVNAKLHAALWVMVKALVVKEAALSTNVLFAAWDVMVSDVTEQ
jgi:hypothetical protein